MKDSRKLLILSQVEKTLQILVNQVETGKASYSKHDLLRIFKAIDNQFIKIANDNYRRDLYLGEDEGLE